MSKSKILVPKVSRLSNLESHTDLSNSPTDSGKSRSLIQREDAWKPIHIATYNIRTKRTEEHLAGLESEIDAIKWDVIGPSKTRLPGEQASTLKSGTSYTKRMLTSTIMLEVYDP